jgi:hypothetical protein
LELIWWQDVVEEFFQMFFFGVSGIAFTSTTDEFELVSLWVKNSDNVR